MHSFTGTQKQIDNVTQNTYNRFKATKGLATNLKKERVRMVDEKRSAMFANVGKELLKQAQYEKQQEMINPKSGNEFSIESEIRALSNYQKPVYNPKTEEMIKKQRESRRDRHIKTLVDYEKWVETLNIDIDEGYGEIKNEIIEYIRYNDIEITEYFNSMSDDYLMSREKEILDEMIDMVNESRQKRNDKVHGLDQRLDEQEHEREKNLKFFCDNLQQQWIDIAFILEPEAVQTVATKRVVFEELVKENLQKNQEYVQKIEEEQIETFVKFEEMRMEVEKRWRKLRHDEAMEQFQEDIKLMEYVNPDERKDLYIDWKIKTKDIYDKRVHFITKLGSCDMLYLTKAIVEKWIEDVKLYNEKAQTTYDNCFNSLMQEAERSNAKAQNRLDILKERLEYVGHILGEELDTLLEENCGVIVKKLNEDARQLMMDAIKYVEDADLKTNEVCLNFGRWFKKIGNKNDEHKVNQKKQQLEYEIQKAAIEDENDENLDKLNEEFEQVKEELKRSLHHPKLDEILEKCFNKIDYIETEYRDVHDKKIECVSKHPDLIKNLFLNYEKNQSYYFELLDASKREGLEKRNKERCEAKVKQIMKQEEKQKLEEEEKAAAELATKKGGKKPPPKKIDPKKQAAEQEQRFNELMEEVGIEPVLEFVTPMGQKLQIAYTNEEIAKKFYEIKEDGEEETEEQEKKRREEEERQEQLRKEEEERLAKEKEEQEKAAKGKKPAKPVKSGQNLDEEKEEEPEEEEKEEIPVDFQPEPPQDPEGIEILDRDVMIKIDFVVEIIVTCQQKMFDFIGKKLNESLEEGKLQDNDFIENSILILDERLKAHYPLKGKVEVDIYQIRSAQITNHKKRYERHARTMIDKIDLQTEHFNFLLETGLEDTKEYEDDQKQCIQNLPTGHTLAKLQGILNTARENSFKFAQKIDDNLDNLEILANDEIDALIQKNVEFIKESKPFEDGGEYDQEEIEWYKTMLQEIDQQLAEQKEKRKQRVLEIQEHMEEKKKVMLEEFEKQYQITIEELSAKDGTGKKFGRPRRLAQERQREEMNKCEKSQEAIQGFLEEIRGYYEEFQEKSKNPEIYLTEKEVFAERLTFTLMALRNCMSRYSKHVEAMKPESKVQEMKRVSYLETQWDLVLQEQEKPKDDERHELELEYLGPLYYQTDNKTFIELVADIEKQVIGEAQKLYVGDKAKFLTGSDRIPDYLRTYLENMKKKANEFKIQCIRDLRNFCQEFSDLAPQISEMLIGSVQLRYIAQIQSQLTEIGSEFFEIKNVNMELKNKHMFQLRPNLSNPSIKEELEVLLEKEAQRYEKYMDNIEIFKAKSLEVEFLESNAYFKALLHHFEFLLTLYDSMILWEDFVKLPGDEDIQKKHENLKVLTRMKQTGVMIDTNSERSLEKTWEGVLIDIFKVGDKKIEYEATPEQEEDPKKGGKKGGKKDAKKDAKKDPKKDAKKRDSQPIQSGDLDQPPKTKEIKSFKTFRQKSASHFKSHGLRDFKDRFDDSIAQQTSFYDDLIYLEKKFKFKWNQTRQQLAEAQQL